MNNDLISREALKEAVYAEFGNSNLSYVFNDIIDNAPTVSPFKPMCKAKDEAICEEMTIDGHCNCIKPCPNKEERTQGEWIDYNAYYKTCSICKRTVGIDFLIQKYEDKPEEYSFCPNCGADMRKGGMKNENHD